MFEREQKGAENGGIFLIHDETLDPGSLADLAPDRPFSALTWDKRGTPPTGARVLLHFSDDQLRELAPLAIERQWEVGVLPHPRAGQATRALGVAGEVEQMFGHYLSSEAIQADVLTCNDQLVFSSVAIGEVLTLAPYDVHHPPTRRGTLSGALRALKNLRLRSYRLTTGKDQKIQLAALGLVVMSHTQSTLIGRCFADALSIADGRLTLLASAPRSILSYLWFLLRLVLPKKISLSRLPAAVGLIRSDRVLLEASRGVDYSLDGTLISAKTVEFRVLENAMHLLPGPALVPRSDRKLSEARIQSGWGTCRWMTRTGSWSRHRCLCSVMPKRTSIATSSSPCAPRLRCPPPIWCSPC